ncbi:SH3 domain-containing protein [Aquimarina sp. MMG016]|uniref:SH3 domain-containing protein n=1 Tax=Aquimarina sp. MMG016 TaxID=2822690 RepID=UPI001B3A73CE|nr:SH3 domain-containing protein [Aquimarina sp. MMG016]MBQ4819630.1 SH3 domain-containing protein [Aquimarina sp. MMG016]
MKTHQLMGLLSILFFFNVLNLCCQEYYYVTATNGLVIRDQPATTGKRIEKLPFGTQVEVIHKTGIELSIKDDGKEIKGEWVEIKLAFPFSIVEEGSSYVFNGYLKDHEKFVTTVTQILEAHDLTETYNLRTDNNPFYLKGDFNGDQVEDHAILIRDKNNNSENELPDGKIAIIHQADSPKIIVLGSKDDPFGDSNYNWVGYFEKVSKGTKIWSNWDDEKDDFLMEDPPEHKKHKLLTDAFFVHNLESCGGGYIYWNKGTYKWMQVE